MMSIDPEAIKFLSQERSESWLQKGSLWALSNCPAHQREGGAYPLCQSCWWCKRSEPAAETQEMELVKLGKEVESGFKFI